jgi:hypothetical protein
MMKIVLFEDSGFENLLPLTYFRPVWELRCGIHELKEKIKQQFSISKLYFSARQYLNDFHLSPNTVFTSGSGEEYLFLNGRLLLGAGDAEKILNILETQLLHGEKMENLWINILKKACCNMTGCYMIFLNKRYPSG